MPSSKFSWVRKSALLLAILAFGSAVASVFAVVHEKSGNEVAVAPVARACRVSTGSTSLANVRTVNKRKQLFVSCAGFLN